MDDWTDAFLKVALAWAAVAYGWFTLQHIATAAAIVYTLLQIYVLVRDKIVRKERS